jgi:hypothetical protein
VTETRTTTTVASVPFARVMPVVRAECQATADADAYKVPCPALLPSGVTVTPPVQGCHFAVVASVSTDRWLGCSGGRDARRWFFGTVMASGPPGTGNAPFQHLVVSGAPRVVQAPRAVVGPGIRTGPLEPRGIVHVDGWLMRFYVVPPGNFSAFRGHLVLVWSQNGQTYVYGFHIVKGLAMARALDLELVRHLYLVPPQG